MIRAHFPLAWFAAAAFALVPLAGCRAILGIEERALSGTGGSGGGGSGGNGPDVCVEYCQTVSTNCIGENDVYTTDEACAETCKRLPPGKPGDVGGNNVHCRLDKAEKATGDVAKFCPAAGVAGSDLCGSDCEVYCALITEVCSSHGGSDDVTVCLEECPTIPSKEPFHVPATPQDSIQCRLHHVTLAMVGNPELHCQHALGKMLCVDP